MSSSGGALPDEVVVLLCILGAAGLTCIGYAVQRHFAKEDFDGAAFNQKPPQQEAYMREVRYRNQMMAFGDARPPRGYPRHDIESPIETPGR